MINIRKKIFFIITSLFYLFLILTLILFLYAAFFFKPPSIEKVVEEVKEDQIKKIEESSNIQTKKEPSKKIKENSKKIKASDVTTTKTVIKDSLFATIGNKAITYSDIINEIKILLILNNQTFSDEKRKQIESAAIKSTVKRNIKKIEIDKYKFLNFNQKDLDDEVKKTANKLNINVETFKNTLKINGIDFSNFAERIKIDLQWNGLIFQIYKDRLTINLEEIEEQLKLIQKKKEIHEYLISEIIIKPVAKENLESKIKEIMNKIKIEGFEKVAKELSISDTSMNGGELGWVNENVISEKFKFKIINTPLGNISEPILMTNGILFFKVRDKRSFEKFVDIEEIKNHLVTSEKTKILNMHSKSHYDNLKRSVAIKFY